MPRCVSLQQSSTLLFFFPRLQMQLCLQSCAMWAGEGRSGLLPWVFSDEEAVSAAADAKAATTPGAAPAHNADCTYLCESTFVATIARRLKRMLEQPPHINSVLTELWTTLLQVSTEC